MKSYDAGMIAELLKGEALPFWFVSLALDSGTYRYTDMDIDYVTSGLGSVRYYARQLKLGGISAGTGMSVDSLRIDIGNADLQISSIFMAEETRFRPVSIGFGVFSASPFEAIALRMPGLGQAMWKGFISTYRITDKVVSVELVNELVLWKKKTLRKFSASCQWPFKGEECGYSGDQTTCDQTYDRCVALGNQDQFGGFRWLPDMMEQEIWWGRVPG